MQTSKNNEFKRIDQELHVSKIRCHAVLFETVETRSPRNFSKRLKYTNIALL